MKQYQKRLPPRAETFRAEWNASRRLVRHLVLDEVRRVIRVAIFQQKVLVDGSLYNTRLKPTQPFQC